MGLTLKRDLRTGSAVWNAYRHPHIPMSALKRATHAEVVVIGAGITGALMSNALTQVGMRPLILDRRGGARLGSTAASTALLQFELDTPLIKLGTLLGRNAAAQVWKCSHAAVNELRTQTNRLRISAHLQTRPSLYLAGNVLDAMSLREKDPLGWAEKATTVGDSGLGQDVVVVEEKCSAEDEVLPVVAPTQSGEKGIRIGRPQAESDAVDGSHQRGRLVGCARDRHDGRTLSISRAGSGRPGRKRRGTL